MFYSSEPEPIEDTNENKQNTEQVLSESSDEDEEDKEYEEEVTGFRKYFVSSSSSILTSFKYTTDTNLYVVAIDGEPSFYVKSEEEAHKKIWEIIRMLAERNLEYYTNCVQISKNELQLIGCFKMYVVSYDRLLHTVSYRKVQECA
jgi:hypothetical protein